MRLILLLALCCAGCQSSGEPVFGFRDTETGPNAKIKGGDKPIYREVTDELGIQKGWKF
jgi:hypothetical protein